MIVKHVSPHIKILRRAINPAWIRHHCEKFKLMFADQPTNKQSGIHINNADPTFSFRNALLAQGWMPSGHFWLADYCSIRQQPPNKAAIGLPWHQDSAVVLGRTFGWCRGFVGWVPFTPVDEFTPTLQLIERRWPLLHRGNQKHGYLEAVREPRGRRVVLPPLYEGDVVLFDINLPHCTFVKEYMNRTRISADLRFVRRVPWTYKGTALRTDTERRHGKAP